MLLHIYRTYMSWIQIHITQYGDESDIYKMVTDLHHWLEVKGVRLKTKINFNDLCSKFSLKKIFVMKIVILQFSKLIACR